MFGLLCSDGIVLQVLLLCRMQSRGIAHDPTTSQSLERTSGIAPILSRVRMNLWTALARTIRVGAARTEKIAFLEICRVPHDHIKECSTQARTKHCTAIGVPLSYHDRPRIFSDIESAGFIDHISLSTLSRTPPDCCLDDQDLMVPCFEIPSALRLDRSNRLCLRMSTVG